MKGRFPAPLFAILFISLLVYCCMIVSDLSGSFPLGPLLLLFSSALHDRGTSVIIPMAQGTYSEKPSLTMQSNSFPEYRV